MGFEPTASRATIWRANQLRHTHHILSAVVKYILPVATILLYHIPIHLSITAARKTLHKNKTSENFLETKNDTPTGVVLVWVARQEGLEPPTYGLEGSCSIQLSYWRTFCAAKQ